MKEEFVKAIEELDEQHARELAEQLKQMGCSQLDIVDLLQLGMKLVGLRYEGGEYFIADLIMSGIIFREILDLNGRARFSPDGGDSGRPDAIIGTVEGDVHDIGKDIFISMLESKDIRTMDLGVDVPPERFVEEIERFRPPIVVLSGTMTFASESMRRTIARIAECGLRDQVKIAVGGSAVNLETPPSCGRTPIRRTSSAAPPFAGAGLRNRRRSEPWQRQSISGSPMRSACRSSTGS